MIDPEAASTRLDTLLARILQYGTWLASSVVFIGVATALFGAHNGIRMSQMGRSVASCGIALFILMPIVRVCAMCAFFAFARDRRLALIAAFVLIILAAGIGLGRVQRRTLR